MPLDARLSSVKEVIHAPLKGDISVEACTGRLGRIEQPLVTSHNRGYPEWLMQRRGEHARHLHEHYEKQPVSRWLERHGFDR